MALFASYVRGQQEAGSDLDGLMTFRETPGLFQFVELENSLSEALGVRVDLVLKDALRPRIGERILRGAVPV